MAYSIDFKKRAVAYKQEGHTFKQLREAFGIPPETHYDWGKKLENGYYQTKARQKRRRKIDKEALKQAVAERPDAYLKELAEPFNCTATAVFYALENLSMTRKKKSFAYYEKSEKQRAEYTVRLKRVPKKNHVYSDLI
jgi:transposase